MGKFSIFVTSLLIGKIVHFHFKKMVANESVSVCPFGSRGVEVAMGSIFLLSICSEGRRSVFKDIFPVVWVPGTALSKKYPGHLGSSLLMTTH